MTLFQLLMLGASAFFAYKIYEHIQTLQDPKEDASNEEAYSGEPNERTADAFSPFDATSLLEKADEAMQKNELDKALAIYSEANIKEPNNDETLFKMGYTLSLQKRYEEALEYFEEALQIDDGNPFTYLEMAKIYVAEEQFDKAKVSLQKALEIEEDLEEAKELLQKITKDDA